MHLLRLAVRPWKTNPLVQIFSAGAAGMALFSAGLATWCSLSLEPLLTRLASEQVITAYLDPEVATEDEGKVVDTIRTALGAQAVTELKLVRSMEFIGQVRAEYPELAEQLESLGGSELEAVVPRYVSAAGNFRDGTLEAIRSVKGVSSIETSANKTASVIGSLGAIRWIAGLVAFALYLTSAGLIAYVTRFNTHQFAEAVAFVRLMGGGAFRARIPGVFSGALFGLTAGLSAAGAWYWGAAALVHRLKSAAPALNDLPAVPAGGTAILLASGFCAGIFFGLFSGVLNRARSGGGGRAWL